ncbi:hypothetical protein I553_2792 [Mycobacterium xenopi 4042]|uniref:Uncharacterized protein n=1 Tax=Mycobacterium xenopi 4042 TaxID=1299334 RepID=X7YYM4_MYCXE|nr:hypothetical protein I553_2792 [Mycobacterium xenopi 4042]
MLIDYGRVRVVCGVVVAALRRGDHRDPGVLKSGAAYLPIDPHTRSSASGSCSPTPPPRGDHHHRAR